MTKKLKTQRLVRYAINVLSLLFLLAPVLLAPLPANADTSSTTLACDDSSQELTIVTNKDVVSVGVPTKKPVQTTLTVSCKSGAKIIYTNRDGLIQTALDVICNGSEKVGSYVKDVNDKNDKIVYYCVNTFGNGDNQTTSAAKDTPTYKIDEKLNERYLTEGSGNEDSITDEYCSKINPQLTVGTDAGGNKVCILGGSKDPAANKARCDKDKCDIISKYVNPLIELLSMSAGIAVACAIVYGGILYSSSAGDPNKAAHGKKVITNAIIGLIMYMLLFAFLQFVVPGGLFR